MASGWPIFLFRAIARISVGTAICSVQSILVLISRAAPDEHKTRLSDSISAGSLSVGYREIQRLQRPLQRASSQNSGG